MFDQGQDRAPAVGDERVADRREDMPDRDAAVLHRHESRRSAELNAQVSTTCWPAVLITLTIWPQRRCAALPLRAGISTSRPSIPRQRANVAEITAAAVYLLAAGTSIGAQFDRPDIRQSSRFEFLAQRVHQIDGGDDQYGHDQKADQRARSRLVVVLVVLVRRLGQECSPIQPNGPEAASHPDPVL